MYKSSKKNQTKNPQKNNKKRAVGQFILLCFLTILVVLVGIAGGFVTASLNTKPNLTEDIVPPASSQIYDIHGKEIANIHAVENRVPVSINNIPKSLQNAFVAVEDNRFYEHIGIDFIGIIRAVWANIRGGGVSEGASTITQQLARNAYLTQDVTLKRKIQEVFLALQLERQYTKQEILEFYLNQIYFGQGAYGVQAAAKTYFGKDVTDLTVNESAILAGIPQSPNYYSPFNNIDATIERKNTVLAQMLKYGYINEREAQEAINEEIKLTKNIGTGMVNGISYFIDYVTQLIVDKYGDDAIYKDGLQIYTTLDMNTQACAYEAMKNLPTFFIDSNGIEQPQGALVAIDPRNGHVKAMIGGRGTDQFNRATQAVRQPGSAFKPFVFVAALENNFTPDTVIEDKPLKVGNWSPQNYDRTFSGKVSLRDVARLSLNVPTVRIAQELGIDNPIYYAQEMGITTFVLDGYTNDRNLSTALGGMTRGVTPVELTSAYGTFANGGIHVEPIVIVKIISRTGKVIEETPQKEHSVISAASTAALTSMLQDVISSGTGTRAIIGRPAAGKTGTTSDYRDAWFVGYTPDLVAGVWVGNDNNIEMNGMSGGLTPAAIWHSFMIKALTNTPISYFPNVELYASRGNKIKELVSDGEDYNTDKNKDDNIVNSVISTQGIFDENQNNNKGDSAKKVFDTQNIDKQLNSKSEVEPPTRHDIKIEKARN